MPSGSRIGMQGGWKHKQNKGKLRSLVEISVDTTGWASHDPVCLQQTKIFVSYVGNMAQETKIGADADSTYKNTNCIDVSAPHRKKGGPCAEKTVGAGTAQRDPAEVDTAEETRAHHILNPHAVEGSSSIISSKWKSLGAETERRTALGSMEAQSLRKGQDLEKSTPFAAHVQLLGVPAEENMAWQEIQRKEDWMYIEHQTGVV
ncbi:hypothetical protein C8R45DRAFT_945914 [Mycena sanguinolenta]|nr:hypothetical protein C8R45DRAFT_945914 [Mycena sanguinolenta]